MISRIMSTPLGTFYGERAVKGEVVLQDKYREQIDAD
jgi:hypothetical protein